MDMRNWIGCIIVIIVVALLVHDRPISIVASDEPVSSPTHVPAFTGQAWAR